MTTIQSGQPNIPNFEQSGAVANASAPPPAAPAKGTGAKDSIGGSEGPPPKEGSPGLPPPKANVSLPTDSGGKGNPFFEPNPMATFFMMYADIMKNMKYIEATAVTGVSTNEFDSRRGKKSGGSD